MTERSLRSLLSFESVNPLVELAVLKIGTSQI